MGIQRVEGKRIGNREQRTVLVVDDDRALATVVAESLEHVDDELVATYTTEPEQALSELERRHIDCLVIDYEMPEVDGLTLVDEDTTDTPFILYTQRRDDGVVSGARERGGEYLPKQTDAEQYHRLAALVHEQAGDG